jgi:hypothetical protein
MLLTYGILLGGFPLVTSAAVLPATGVPLVVVLSADFDAEALGPVEPEDFVTELGPTSLWAPNFSDMTIADDTRGSGRVLRVHLEAGTIRGAPAGNHGVALDIRLPGDFGKACISYDVRFDPDFDWSLGGKLPGLLGVAPGVSPSAPAGGHPTSAGWSGRVMWVGPKAYSWAGPSNMIVSYLYPPGQRSAYGDNLRWGRGFGAGRWHTVQQCYSMNTVGRDDGVLRAWLDGRLVLEDRAVRYRTSDDVRINYLAWDVFRGGSTLQWAGSRDDYIDIDNVVITGG